MSWKILVTARTIPDVGQAAAKRLRDSGCEVVMAPKMGPLTADELSPLLPGMDAALISPDQVPASLLKSPEAAQLKIISRWGVGYDSIDIHAATEAGIIVAYTPGLLNEAVADYTFALLLSLARRVHEVHAMMSQGTWKLTWGIDVHEKTLGLIGCGRIGQAVARRAAGFNMRVLAYDVAPGGDMAKYGAQLVSLDELLAQSDFVSLHCALTRENRGFFGEELIRKMKPGAMVVNTARGALVDEPALAGALRDGRLGGAALDVFNQEPLPAGHLFAGLPNVLLSPHQAPCARETGARVSMVAAESILTVMNGRRPSMVVNPAVFESPGLRARLG